MPPACSLHLISRVHRIRHSIRFELDGLRLINISHVGLVVSDVCDLVLLELLWLGPLNITEIHVVATLNQLLLSIGVGSSTIYIFDVKLVVVEELSRLSFIRYLWLQHS